MKEKTINYYCDGCNGELESCNGEITIYDMGIKAIEVDPVWGVEQKQNYHICSDCVDDDVYHKGERVTAIFSPDSTLQSLTFGRFADEHKTTDFTGPMTDFADMITGFWEEDQ